ncbi:MAG: hypothetical protein H6R26_824 [Proteobacteria bacterium]|nr:hypothetical protein [Pseudomonadota bacterium]
MKPVDSRAIKIVSVTGDPGLSKAQKRFNSLIKKLDQQKSRLREWSESIPHIQQYAANEYEPLYGEYRSLEMQRLRLLDEAHSDPAFKKRDRDKLSHLICEFAGTLISGNEDDDLKELYNRHSGSDYDEDQRDMEASAGNLIKSMMEEMLGMDLRHEDLSSPDKFHDFLENRIMAEQAEREAQRAKRKKSKRQEALEAQREAERTRIKQSIQEIYRKLATQLHPDRESDPVERERKTQLMQQVNQAYGKKDLLRLLELQLQAEQIDQSHINQIAEDRLQSYNQILKEQSDELQKEIAEIESTWRMQLNIPPFATVTPKALMAKLREDIQQLRYQVAMVKHDLVTLADPKHLKAWLKSYKISRAVNFDDIFFDKPPFGGR